VQRLALCINPSTPCLGPMGRPPAGADSEKLLRRSMRSSGGTMRRRGTGKVRRWLWSVAREEKGRTKLLRRLDGLGLRRRGHLHHTLILSRNTRNTLMSPFGDGRLPWRQ
jgi:hypothetical protein